MRVKERKNHWNEGDRKEFCGVKVLEQLQKSFDWGSILRRHEFQETWQSDPIRSKNKRKAPIFFLIPKISHWTNRFWITIGLIVNSLSCYGWNLIFLSSVAQSNQWWWPKVRVCLRSSWFVPIIPDSLLVSIHFTLPNVHFETYLYSIQPVTKCIGNSCF